MIKLCDAYRMINKVPSIKRGHKNNTYYVNKNAHKHGNESDLLLNY